MSILFAQSSHFERTKFVRTSLRIFRQGRVNNIETEVAATSVSFAANTLNVTLNDGRVISVPLEQVEWLQWLAKATPEQRQAWSIEPSGYAVYWDKLDDGIEICHLLTMRPLT